jgi:outer membrane protein assembly factor BamE (lipoprotein component of BamABCDE complex)
MLCGLLAGCPGGLSPTEEASASYKQNKDYASLEQIYSKLSNGMQRMEVERLLGEPDYSPIDGQYYYSTDRSDYSEEQKREVAAGLVVDYRDKNGDVTDTLQEYWLGVIAE